MPSMNDVRQQLREWEQSHTTVMLSFSEYLQFWLHLFGRIHCGTNCRNFDLISHNAGGGRFSSPSLSAFKVVSLGPDPNSDNHTTIRLRHRRRRWEIKLAEAGTEPTLEEIQAVAEAFIASQKPAKRKSYVQ